MYTICTYLDKDIENPLLVFLLSSKIVLRSYLEEPGELVKSFVKSDFRPYPIAAPALLKVEGVS